MKVLKQLPAAKRGLQRFCCQNVLKVLRAERQFGRYKLCLWEVGLCVLGSEWGREGRLRLALPHTPLFGQLDFFENFWSFEAASSLEVSCRTCGLQPLTYSSVWRTMISGSQIDLYLLCGLSSVLFQWEEEGGSQAERMLNTCCSPGHSSSNRHKQCLQPKFVCVSSAQSRVVTQ